MQYLKLTMSFAMPSGQLAQNVYVVRSSVPWTFPSSAATVVTWLVGMWTTYLRPWLPTALRLISVLVHEYVPGEGWQPRYEASYSLAGTGSGEPLPPQVSQLITFGGGDMGRRGKKYIPATTETYQNNGQLSTGFVTALANFGAQLANVSSTGGVFVKFGFATMNGNVLTLFHPFNGFVRVPLLTVTQRRRRLGSGV